MDLNASTSSSRRRRTRSSESITDSPTASENSRKRPRNLSEPSSETISGIPRGNRTFDEEETILSDANDSVADGESKSDKTVKTELNTPDENILPDSTDDTDFEMLDNRGLLFEKIFKDVVPINAEFDGNSFFIIGTSERAKRIEKKFVIMQKLANLVGCGLDCHFRLANGEYRLMMLVRGAPRVLFGTTVSVIPDLTDTRKYATPGEFVEAGQVAFFESILELVPRNLMSAVPILRVSLMNGEEDGKVQKFYEFLKNIRTAVLSQIATIPIAWHIQDFPSNNESLVQVTTLRNVMKQCGDNHLLKLESARPGFTNMFCSTCGLGPAQTFEQMMELKFQNF